MFTQEQLEGIILSLANPEINLERDSRQSIGYRIKLRIHFRASNIEFLEMLEETLNQYGIDTYLKRTESVSRPYPLLRITKVDNLINFLNLLPDLPSSSNKFEAFKEVLTIVSNKHHLLQKGFDRVLEIKGIIT
jgi:hypothetical protein|tara:strand:- start:387 stop:788 length:402 start_codon:yes stop_codon:yes gene_type:complete